MIRNFERSIMYQVKLYFDRLPHLVEYWKEQGWNDEEQNIDMWTVMMLRAFCWGICHFFVPGERVPIGYYGSQLPVWLS
jgi:DNA-binding transcriptional regulator YbjK